MTKTLAPSDIESKLREIQGEIDTVATAAMPAAVGVGVAVVTGIAAIAYFVGQRNAKKRSTVVEVRRV